VEGGSTSIHSLSDNFLAILFYGEKLLGVAKLLRCTQRLVTYGLRDFGHQYAPCLFRLDITPHFSDVAQQSARLFQLVHLSLAAYLFSGWDCYIVFVHGNLCFCNDGIRVM